MGERLNLEITSNMGVLANAYYHWSGYTDCAVELAEIAVEKYDMAPRAYGNREKPDMMLSAIRMLESTGAGMTEPEWKRANEFFWDAMGAYVPLKGAITRNEGLIGVSEEEILSTRRWAEETVILNIDTRTADFSGAFIAEPCADFFEWHEDVNVSDLPLVNQIDPHNVPFASIPQFKAFVNALLNSYGSFRLESDPDTVYSVVA